MSTSNSIHDIQEIGFRAETVEGVSDITSSVKPINFGQYTTSWGLYPQLIQDIISLTKGGSFDPYLIKIIKTSILGQISYVPIDSTMWFHALGSGSGAAGEHTIQGISSGDLPSYSIRSESGNGTEADHIRYDAVGLKTARLSATMDLKDPKAVLTENVSYIGRKAVYNADLGAQDARISPIFADGDVNDLQNRYTRDKNFSVKFDPSGINLELEDYLFNMDIILDNQITPRPIKGQLFPQWVGTGNRLWTAAFKMRRSNENRLFDQFIGQRSSTLFKDLTYTIHNGTTFRTYTLTDVVFKKCDLNDAFTAQGQEPFYDIELISHSGKLVTNDGVASSFYGY